MKQQIKLVLSIAAGVFLGLCLLFVVLGLIFRLTFQLQEAERQSAEQRQIEQLEQREAEIQRQWENMVDKGDHPGFLPQNRMP